MGPVLGKEITGLGQAPVKSPRHGASRIKRTARSDTFDLEAIPPR